MGSYSYFNQGVAIENSMAFQAPDASGVQLHDMFTVFLNGPAASSRSSTAPARR